MLAHFRGAGEVVNAYESGLPGSDVDLVMLEGAFGQAAVGRLCEVAVIPDENARAAAYKDFMYNEVPRLPEAEQVLVDWAADNLPPGLKLHPALEATVFTHIGPTPAHSDEFTLNHPVHGPAPEPIVPFMYGPYASSVGTKGTGIFEAKRLPRPLTAEEVLSGDIPYIDDYEQRVITDRRLVVVGASVAQNPGDWVLIPDTPHPSIHGVRVEGEPSSRESVTSSTIITNEQHSPLDTLRRFDIIRKEWIRQIQLKRGELPPEE